MGDNLVTPSAAQLVATLKHENMQLHNRLAEVRYENHVLKKQLYHLGALLDIAVSKLAAKGIILETPIGIRELRAVVSSRDVMDAPSDAMNANSLAYENSSRQNLSNRCFQRWRELREHTKPVQCAAFAPGDRPIIATGGLDCRIILQNFFTGEKVFDIKGHEQNITEVAWFEGSGNVLSASFDGTVKVWDPRQASSTATAVYQHNAVGVVLAAVPLDKAFLFACTDSKRYTSIVDLRTQKPVSWRHEVRANTLTFNSSSAHLVTGHNNGTIAVWDVRKIGLTVSSISSIDGDTSASGGPGTLFSSALMNDSSTVSVPHISVFENEPSQSAITYVGFYDNRDDSRRLVVVSADNMVRLYRQNRLNTASGDIFSLRNLIGGVPTRGYNVKAAFWKGVRSKINVSSFFDDVERESEIQSRHLTNCDLIVTPGAENTACIYDVTQKDSHVLVEKLEGHRDRVVGATVRQSDNTPIIATYSADNTVRMWAPAKK